MLNRNYSCDAKLNILASLLQYSESHNPSEIILMFWFAAQETFIYFCLFIICMCICMLQMFYFILFVYILFYTSG